MKNTIRLNLPTRSFIALIGAASLMVIASCGDQSVSPQGSTTNKGTGTTLAKGVEVNTLPLNGKVTAAVAPPKAVFGMIWVNTAENRAYIFDGAQWVPHDQSVDDFYKAQELKAKSTPKTVAMTQDEVCVDGDPSCTPTGAHGPHTAYDCKVCHKVGGRLSFSKTSTPTAYGTNMPTPTFDATAKTCSNIACHFVPPGQFSFYSVDGSGEGYLVTVNYGGQPGAGTTPSWTGTTGGCASCHGDPPRNGSDGSNVWHSGYHGGQGPTGARNQCQFCHPDASSPGNGIGDTITDPSKHTNGVVNVQATFNSTCFGCH
jgi:Geobacter CxxxxCH...CXXCH motif (GSu_C4xC__C2xCH)